jgi:(p)ppGpp synthase/HD superfamily hydrolase
MVHTIGVAHLVLRCGGTEAEVIAAILHDVVEDTPVKLVAIRRIFGHEAAGLVWEVTKEEGVDHLTKIGDAALVKLCDSVYNISRIGGLKPARKERLVVKYTRNFQVLLTRPRLVGLALPGDVQEVVSRDSADFLA